MGSQHHAPAALPPERPGTHCTEGWVGLRAGLGVCEKFRPQPGFDPRTVSIPTELSRPSASYFQPVYLIKHFPLKPSNLLSIMSLPILHSFPDVIINSDKHGHYLKVLVGRHVKLFFGIFNRSRSMPLRFPPKTVFFPIQYQNIP
jgi:hypothetical protein